MYTFPSCVELSQSERIFGRPVPAPKRVKKLVVGVPGVALDRGGAQLQRSPSSKPDLHVATDQPEEGAERVFGIVESEQPGRPARFEQRLQPLADARSGRCPARWRRDCSCRSPAWLTATRFSAIEVSAGNDFQPVGGEALQAVAQRPQRRASGGRSCRRAPSKPASARSRSAARRGRRTICRAFPWSSWRAAPRPSWSARRRSSTSRRKRGVEHRLLALGRVYSSAVSAVWFIAWHLLRSSVPYVTVRRNVFGLDDLPPHL